MPRRRCVLIPTGPTRWLVSNGQFRAPWRNRSKPAPPERTLSDFWRPADQITLSKIAIFGGGRLFAIQNTSHLGPACPVETPSRTRRYLAAGHLPHRAPAFATVAPAALRVLRR